MKVALICEYYPPYTPGGAEWSIFYIAQGLINQGIEVIVITPNYGTTDKVSDPSKFDDQGIRVIRYKLPLGRYFKGVLSPIWLNNPLFWVYSGIIFSYLSVREKVDIIHVQSKYSIPGALLAKLIKQLPIVVTFREKVILCPYNYCISENRLQACNLIEFLTTDLPWYYRNYSKPGSIGFIITLISGIWGWFSCRVLREIAKLSDKIITISFHDKQVFETNGFENVQVIYNTIDFPGIRAGRRDRNLLLYAGRITYGKGVHLLLSALEKVVKINPKVKLELAGAGDPITLSDSLKKNVKFLGVVNHQSLLKKYDLAAVVVQPTITVEAFGRVALEALSRGIPVVVTNIGGLPEIVENKVTGLIVKPNVDQLSDGILNVLKNQDKFRQNIKRNYSKLKEKFGRDIIGEHLKMYKGLK